MLTEMVNEEVIQAPIGEIVDPDQLQIFNDAEPVDDEDDTVKVEPADGEEADEEDFDGFEEEPEEEAKEEAEEGEGEEEPEYEGTR